MRSEPASTNRQLSPVVPTAAAALLAALLWGSALAAPGDVRMEPPVAQPDADGVVQFSIIVEDVPAPGFGSLAMGLRFEGDAAELLTDINPFVPASAPAPDKVSCAAVLGNNGPVATVIPGMGIFGESSVGTLVRNSVGGGTILATENGIVDVGFAHFNLGVGGDTAPQTGSGSVVDMVCYVGAAVPNGTVINVTPTFFGNLDGVVLLAQSGSPTFGDQLIGGTIEVGAGNAPPEPGTDSFNTPEDTAVSVPVLANDSDPNGDPLSLVDCFDPVGGEVSVDGTACRFLPATNQNSDRNGPFGFSYRVSDGALTADALATGNVTAVNDPPIAVDDAASTMENRPVTVAVLGNDSDVEDDPLTVARCEAPSNGEARIDGNACLYDPDDGFVGSDSFVYAVSDGNDESSAVVEVAVSNNEPPTANPDPATTDEDVSVLIDIAANDTDPEGDALTVIDCGEPAHGTAEIEANACRYAPDDDFNGDDGFEYRISDGINAVPGTVAVTVNPVNDAPSCDTIDDRQVDEGIELFVPIRCQDLEGDSIAIDCGDAPTDASCEDLGDGNAEFRWTPGFFASGQFGPVQVRAIDDGAS